MIVSRRNALALAAGLLPLCRTAAWSPPASIIRTRFGINYNQLFLSGLYRRAANAPAALKILAGQHVPFVRFAAAGQWAGQWGKLASDPKGYWELMDAVFSSAADNRVQLIPTVLWNTVALAMHCGEPMQAWTDPGSRTSKTAQDYVEAFVDRYDRSPALMMYEFTNELNDWVDVPNVLQYWPKPDPTVPDRAPSPHDRLTSPQLLAMANSFAATIRRRSAKPISPGFNIPRFNAWHLAHGSQDRDTTDLFIAQLRAITPPEMKMLSIHVYENNYGGKASIFATLPALLQAFVQAARADGRKTFIGEFGVSKSADPADDRRRLTAMTDAISAAGVDYAALWNYSPVAFQPTMDISTGNERAYQLEAIAQANRK